MHWVGSGGGMRRERVVLHRQKKTPQNTILYGSQSWAYAQLLKIKRLRTQGLSSSETTNQHRNKVRWRSCSFITANPRHSNLQHIKFAQLGNQAAPDSVQEPWIWSLVAALKNNSNMHQSKACKPTPVFPSCPILSTPPHPKDTQAE